jgi:hypothetical protein
MKAGINQRNSIFPPSRLRVKKEGGLNEGKRLFGFKGQNYPIGIMNAVRKNCQ